MRSLHHLRGRRLLGALAVLAAVAVAIPATSGAGAFARNGARVVCSHACAAAALVTPAMLKTATGAPKGDKPGPGKG